LEKGDLGGFKNRQLEGIYGNRYNFTLAASGRDVNGWAGVNPVLPAHKKGPRRGAYELLVGGG
jgi:hypothetical protein